MPCGSYGQVRFTADGDRAIKRVKLFSEDNYIDGTNLNDAVMASTPRKIKNCILAKTVSMCNDGEDIDIEMDKAAMTFDDYVRKTPYRERMAGLPTVVNQLVVGLHSMHQHGIAHCDLKPQNIVLGDKDIATLDNVRIIDFGSTRYFERNDFGEVMGTYVFAPPEVFTEKASPSPSCDAYSLGATIFFCIYKSFLYDHSRFYTFDDVCELHEDNGIDLPDTCPPGAPDEMFDVMIGLLNPDPTKRLTIQQLYNDLCQNETTAPKPDHVILDGKGFYSGRLRAIDYIFARQSSHKVAPLAMNILDRFVAASSDNHKIRVAIRPALINICVTLATLVIYPDTDIRIRPATKKWAISVMSTLGFKLYSDTCDVVLKMAHNVPEIDWDVLKQAMKNNYLCHNIVAEYLEKTAHQSSSMRST